MSKPFTANKTNRTPMADLVKLVSYTRTEDADGYDASKTPTEREIWCSFFEGASRAEYYEATKAGVRISATVEIWEDDFDGERELIYGSRRFQIGRVWPTGRGTLQLMLTEVWR